MWFFSRKTRRASKLNTPRPRCRLQVERLEDRCLLSAGMLDPTFGSGGIVTTAISRGSNGEANAVLVQPDSKIVAVGDPNFSVVRYNPNGSLDTSFGSGGKVTTTMGNAAHAAALYPAGTANAGKIIVAGTYQKAGNIGDEFGLVRYNANGSLDTSFGNKGKVVTDVGSFYNEIDGVALQSDGKIVVVGMTQILGSSSNGYEFALARYNDNGTLDTSFGSGGKVITKIASGDEWFNAVAIQSDGKIVAAGYAGGIPGNTYPDDEIVVVRYTSNGSLDTNSATGFGPLDPITLNRPGWASPYQSGQENAYALALQADGKIVVAGQNLAPDNSGAHFVLARFNPDGSRDGTFGSAGKVVTQVAGNDWAFALAVQPNGKIIAAGTSNPSYYSGFNGFALARYNVNGSLDDGSPNDSTPGDSFGTGGKSITVIGTGQNGIRGLALQPDGNIVAAGFSSSGFTLARYLAAEPQIGSAAASSNSVTAGSSVTLTASNITDGNPSSTITQVAFYYFNSSGNKVVLGYGTQTSAGVWTFTFSTAGWASGSYTLFAQAEDNYGVFGDPFALTLTVQ